MLERLNRIDRGTLTVIGLLLAVILFLAVNVFSTVAFTRNRIDFTQDRLYTLSDGTREVLRGVQEPIRLRLYQSQNLLDAAPAFATYAARVRELLETYVALTNGRVRLEVINPEPFSPEEDRAVGFGLQGVPVTQAGERGYFGLVGTNTTDDRDVIPLLTPEREAFLEYDLTRLVYNLANPRKPVIALIDGVQMSGSQATRGQPWAILEQMRQFFDVRTLGGEVEKLADDVNVALIVHPQDLSEKTVYAIDQFVLRGGRAMVFVDPHAEVTPINPMAGAPPQTSSNLPKLFQAWGVQYDPEKVVADRQGAIRVQARSGGREVVTEYLPWVALRGDAFKKDDVATAQLELLNVMSAGALSPAEGAATQMTPLLQSSPLSALVSADRVKVMPDPLALARGFKPEGKRLTIGARVSGEVSSAFPDGPPKQEAQPNAPPPAETQAPAAHLAKSTQPVNVIVVADVDMLSDRGWLDVRDMGNQRLGVPFANNADFVINALDNLTGSAALIGLRSRGISNRPFDVVAEMQRRAEQQFRAKEQELLEKLKETERKLTTVQGQDRDRAGNTLLTSDQQQAIQRFRAEMMAIRSELREVQRALRSDIDRMETRLKLLNIAAVPGAVAVFAIILALWRWLRSRRDRAARRSESYA